MRLQVGENTENTVTSPFQRGCSGPTLPHRRIAIIVGGEYILANDICFCDGNSMDLSDLRFFEAVSRHGSMNRAASELHTVQSNVTARIRALEEELGVNLFQRHRRGVTTTPAGQRVLPFVARISKLMSDVRSAASDDGVPTGTLALGSLETTTALRLSPLAEQICQDLSQCALGGYHRHNSQAVGGCCRMSIGRCICGRSD